MSIATNLASELTSKAAPRELAMLLEDLTDNAVPAGVLIRGLTAHSKRLCAHDLFVALRGQHVNGCDFLPEAVARGAAAAVCDAPFHGEFNIPVIPVAGLTHKLGVIADRFFASPSADMRVIAVTGTDGKTSVAHFIAEAMQLKYGACGLIGTLGYGRFDELRESPMTTPDAIRMHYELHELKVQNVDSVVMEASSHGLDQGRLVGVDIDVAVFTNLGRDHLDYHVSQQDYAAAKARLFERGNCRRAVINVADPFGCELIQRCRDHCEVISYAVTDNKSDADVTAVDVQHSSSGLTFELCVGGERFTVTSPLIGRFNVDNLLAVFAALFVLGVTPEEAASLLTQVRPVRGRMQRINGNGRCAVVDYAHTPDALESALRACREITAGRLWCVFGCGGDRDQSKRALMGAVASRLADAVVISNDNPRSEDPQRIVKDIEQGLEAAAEVEVIYDRERAIRHALSAAAADDCILIAGKGHETFQIIATRRLPFDDATVVRRAFKELSA